MKAKIQYEAGIILRAFLNSYAQVFFSEKRFFALILVLVTFFDVYAGLSGLFAVLTTLSVAYIMGFNRQKIAHGWYGFNSLLVGLGLGIYFEPGWAYFFILVLASILTLFLSVSLEGVIGKYALPYLSVPFIFAVWTVVLATRQFEALGISQRGIYTLNDLYLIGGSHLVSVYEWWNGLLEPGPLKTYLISLGAIFFQFNVLSGIIIAAGLLLYSRIAFSLSLLGFYAAYLFYQFIGANLSDLHYSYIGFNYILTSIAIGGFFIIPSGISYLWTLVLIPLVAILTTSLHSVFTVFDLPIYSLPFNITVLMFLYVLKFRTGKNQLLHEVYIQQNSPEKNLYSFQNRLGRFGKSTQISMQLPFRGPWTVSQAHDGEITHKDEWRHAWDFIMSGSDGKSYKNNGDFPEDYHCFGKDVTAPAAGVIEEVVDGIGDNKIGDVNTYNNWGNTVIIKHSEYLYSKLCHLKKDSIGVRKGDQVKQGEVLARAGNSGRSPYPHLHFQFQATPFIGSRTLKYPFLHYIRHSGKGYEHLLYGFPGLDEKVSNVQVNPLLYSAFNLVPGKKLHFLADHGNGKIIRIEWEIFTNIYNQSYIWCRHSKSAAYFTNDGGMLVFTHFEGRQNSLLHYYYLAAYRVQLGFYRDLALEDSYPLNHLVSSYLLFLHDFVAPFFFLFRTKYRLRYVSIDDVLSPEKVCLEASAVTSFIRKKVRKMDFTLTLGRQGLSGFIVSDGKTRITAKCTEPS